MRRAALPVGFLPAGSAGRCKASLPNAAVPGIAQGRSGHLFSSAIFELKSRQEFFVFPFIVVAFVLPFLGDDFNLVFNIHSVILSGFFLMAFIAMWRSKIKSFGGHVMRVALGLLVLDFMQYFAIFTARQYIDIPDGYLVFNPVIDLVMQILLGFGMVIVLLEQVLADARIANENLKKAHERLEELAHIDPLTTPLNRHAFHGYLKHNGDEDRTLHGCVGFFDIDDLKEINDLYGHAVGDVAIRSVVKGIREIIRAEDLIFRWGGDEFFVIMIGLDSDSAESRMARMDSLLTNLTIDEIQIPSELVVESGICNLEYLSDV